MKKIFSFFLFLAYSFLSLFGFSFDDGGKIWTQKVIFNIKNRTDIFCPSDNVWVNGTQYPSVIRLSDGTLLATFEVFDKDRTGFRIMSGTDSGDNWEQCSYVSETLDDSIDAAWNPCLIELTEPIGAYEKGTIILAAVSIDPTQSRKSQISVYVSADSAKTWAEISAVDAAGGTAEGVWEPWLAYENGFMYCFYSDDSDEKCSQTIVYRRSSDLVNWSEKTAVVKSDNPDDRPGMPVLTKMGNGKWFLCYEYGRDSGYPVYCKTSDSLEKWDAADTGRQVKTAGGKMIGSAPSCIWIPEGGKNGMLIVSGKYGNSRNPDLLVSYNFGRSFKKMKNPLEYSDRQGFGYHASFFYSEDDSTLYYSNAIDYKDNLSKISFARIIPETRRMFALGK